jgi:hypothetical protein
MPRPSAKRVAQAREKIDRIRQALGELDTLCSGTLLTRMKVCGKPGCRCASDPSARHGPYYEWGHMKDGVLVHRSVTPAAGPNAAAGHRQPPQSQKAHASLGRGD